LKSHFFGFLRNRLTAFLDQTETVSFFFYFKLPERLPARILPLLRR